MKKISYTLLLTFSCFLLTNCFEDLDDNTNFSSLEVKDFVWSGLNSIYLYKDNVPDLANDRFSGDEDYTEYLNSFSTPVDLFNNLIYMPETVDRFSWIVDDYIALEQQFSGTTLNNGMAFALARENQSSTTLLGYVRYIMPDSDASTKDIERGDFFYAVDGQPITLENFTTLFRQNSYTISLAAYNTQGTPETSDDTIDPTGETVTLNKTAYTENPIHKTELFTVNNQNVGYLMYNGFTSAFDSQLNQVFGDFLANNIQYLVLDLRYNPGGSVNTSILLASMIANLNGEIFNTELWNSELQAFLEENSPESLVNYFTNNDEGTPLNTLNLDRVYILTTGSSASASEAVINSLRPYLGPNLVHIGTNTSGKYQASITIYDSEDFTRNNVNPNHTYAMQPLIYKYVNANGFTDFDNGLQPNIVVSENFADLGVLGDSNETLLEAALMHIETNSRPATNSNRIKTFEVVKDNTDFTPLGKKMYSTKPLPNGVLNKLLP